MKSTRRRLLSSVLALIMCIAMLVGTTFAWFTDSVTSGTNKIIAGNLDVELYAGSTKVTESTNTLFKGVTLWEPGAVAYETLTVKNVGDLALKYQMSINFTNEIKVDGHGLSEVLKVGSFEGAPAAGATRDEVLAKVSDWSLLASFSKSGNLAAKTDDGGVTYVIYWQPGDNDNTWNMNNDNQGNTLSIDLGVELLATQDTVETDSFDKLYDIEAPWLGGIGELPEAKDGVIEIASAEQLAALSIASASDVQNKTVKLVKDIDLNNISWKPISIYASWTFDGNGHTILNLNVASEQRGNGLFSWCPGLTVKNLTVNGAKISGTGMDGVIAGNGTCIKVDKCTVKNAEVISNPNIKDAEGEYNGDKSGIIVGYLCADGGNASVTNCLVESSKVKGYRDIGGLVGYVSKSSTATATVTDNTVKDSTVTCDDTNNYKNYTINKHCDVNDVIGEETAGVTVSNNRAVNVTVNKGSLPDSVPGATSGGKQMTWEEFISPENAATVGFNPDDITETTVKAGAFYGNTNITEIVFPATIKTIENNAFDGCMNLKSVKMDGVTTIGEAAFQSCQKLESVEIPSTVTSIGKYAFNGCSALKSVSLPEGVEVISDSSFSGCTNLTSISIPSTVNKIYYQALNSSSLTDIYFNGTSDQWMTIDKGVGSSLPYIFQTIKAGSTDRIVHCSNGNFIVKNQRGDLVIP